jgi:hypothetical protein
MGVVFDGLLAHNWMIWASTLSWKLRFCCCLEFQRRSLIRVVLGRGARAQVPQ